MIWSRATLLLLCACTFLLGLGSPALTDSDEAFYAEASREMVESGDWLTPHFNYEDRWQKPVLYYWLTAATYLITGASEGAARFWAALSGVGLVLVTWAAARTLGGVSASAQGFGARAVASREGAPTRSASTVDPAWLAAAIVATCFGYFAEARLALPDLPLAFCITLTIWAAFGTDLRWWMVAGLGAGLGLLIKGPVAVVIPALVLLPLWWRDRRSIDLRWSGPALAVLAAAVVGLPWYAAMWRTHGTEYLRYFFIENNVDRFATDAFNEPRPFWFYGPILLGGMLPWTAYLVAFALDWLVSVVSGFRRRVQLRRTAGPPEGRHHQLSNADWSIVLWASMPLLFYTVSIGKQPRYILPVLPPVAILMARGIAGRIERARASATSRVLAAATWGTAALFLAFAVLLARAQPLFISAYPALTWIAVAVVATSAVAIAIVAATRRWDRLPAVMTTAAVLLLMSVQFGTFAGKRPEAVERMAALVRSNRYGNEPVGEYEVFVRNLVFYLGFKQQALFDERNVIEFVRSPARVLLVLRSDNLAAVQEASGVNLKILGRVPYLNSANLKVRTLLAPDPSRDIETVFLVTNR